MTSTHFPVLEGQRILLREIKDADIGRVFEGLSHPEVIKHYGVSYSTLEDTRTQMNWFRDIYNENTGIWWGIASKKNKANMLGACGFNNWDTKNRNAEIGYWLLPENQRNGIMSEAMELMIPYGFNQMKLHRIHAIVEPENLGSIWLLEKSGFFQEGVKKEAEWKNGKFIDLLEYALLNPNH